MSLELLPKILTSCLLGFVIGGLDLAGLFLTVKVFYSKTKGRKIYVAFFVSEMVRLTLVIGILLALSFVKSLSFGWLVVGPLLFTIVKFAYAFWNIKQL